MALALLVGGTGAFVVQQQQAHADHLTRLDAEPLSEVLPPVSLPALSPGGAPTLIDVQPRVERGPSLVRVAEPPSRSAGPARPALSQDARFRHHRDRSFPTGRHRGAAAADESTGYPATLHATGELNWTALARCEAGGNPHAVDPSGRYGGLYQFDRGTWHSLGGTGRPQDASPAEQTERARRLYRQRGTAPWPSCGHRAAG
jgi:hypothetical protein